MYHARAEVSFQLRAPSAGARLTPPASSDLLLAAMVATIASPKKQASQKALSSTSRRKNKRLGGKMPVGSPQRAASSAGSSGLTPGGASSAGSGALVHKSKIQRVDEGADLQQIRLGKKQKTCAFLCGAICFETKDPCNKNRDSIRWAYDVAQESQSRGVGANDWYCERAWAEIAATTQHRDRAQYQSDLSKDRDKLSAFLERRQQVIDRTSEK